MTVDWIMPKTMRNLGTVMPPRPSGKERRRFARVSICLSGRLLAPNGQEYTFRTLDASPGGLCLVCETPMDLGSNVVMYNDELGRLAGQITRSGHDSTFGIVLDAKAHKREKLAETLTWLVNGRDTMDLEGRRTQRVAASGAAVIELEDGTQLDVEMLDLSVVGAAVISRYKPLIGAWVRLGAQSGRVARYIENGFAVDFQPRAPR